MKVRNGFVSNSSSSSFLVGIPKECVTYEDYVNNGVYYWEYNGESEHAKWYILDGLIAGKIEDNKDVSCLGCIKTLWEDILRKNDKANMNDWIDHIHGGDIPEGTLAFGYYTFVDTISCPHNVSHIYRDIYGDKMAEKIKKNLERIGSEWNSVVGEAVIREVFKQFDDNVYEVSYSDNDGAMSSLMEHGSFWKYIPHIKISHH